MFGSLSNLWPSKGIYWNQHGLNIASFRLQICHTWTATNLCFVCVCLFVAFCVAFFKDVGCVPSPPARIPPVPLQQITIPRFSHPQWPQTLLNAMRMPAGSPPPAATDRLPTAPAPLRSLSKAAASLLVAFARLEEMERPGPGAERCGVGFSKGCEGCPPPPASFSKMLRQRLRKTTSPQKSQNMPNEMKQCILKKKKKEHQLPEW